MTAVFPGCFTHTRDTQARLLLATGRRERLMAYVPELYVEATVDAFHALRRGDPPFTPAGAGGAGSPSYSALGDIITFLVRHFNDVRIVNPDVRDVLLQSISVLLQYKVRAIYDRSRETLAQK